jgi:16S rRNA (guanine527-N7)-methyltransferase
MPAGDSSPVSPDGALSDRPILSSEASTSTEAVEQLRAGVREHLGLTLTPAQLDAFHWYLDELLLWNTRHNLTAIVEPSEIVVKHFLDSLTILPRLGRAAAGRVIDIGTGAGFPGLPLRIVAESMQLTLVEATTKKVDFCRAVVSGLSLRRVEVLHARAEDLGHLEDHREVYDVALARAVAAMPVLVEYLLPFVRVGGRVLAQKGEGGPAEAQQAEAAIRLLGGRLRQILPVELPGVAEARYLLEIDKIAATPEGYPRRAGVPTKRPLR